MSYLSLYSPLWLSSWSLTCLPLTTDLMPFLLSLELTLFLSQLVALLFSLPEKSFLLFYAALCSLGSPSPII